MFWICGRLLALDPSHAVTQYAHSVWTPQDAALPGGTLAIAQTTDANLWIGTEFGLVRFDGVRFRSWRPPAGTQLFDEYISALMPSKDGSLWIGTKQGLSHWARGRLENYRTGTGSTGPSVAAILEDHEGSIWAATIGYRSGGLCRVEKALHCYGPGDGLPGTGASALFQDTSGTLWVAGLGELLRWMPGERRVYPLTGPLVMIRSMVQDKRGELWMSTGSENGLLHFVNGKLQPYGLDLKQPEIQPRSLLADRDGGLWIGTWGQGIIHLANGRVDRFSRADGLSNDTVRCLFEDQEGNVWAGTDGGLDQFREFPVTMFSKPEGLSGNVVSSVFAAADGVVWIGTNRGMNSIKDGKITASDASNGLPSQSIIAIFEDRTNRLWVDTPRGLAYREDGRFRTLDQPLARSMISIVAAVEDFDHSIWLSDPRGLAQLRDRRLVGIVPWSDFLGRQAWALEADKQNGGIRLGFSHGGLAYYKHGLPIRWYGAAEGLAPEPVTDLHFTQDHALWIATQKGLGRLKNGHFATLGTTNGLPCDRIHAMVEDDDGALWLNTACGLIRIAATELAAWSAKPQGRVQIKLYGSGDGMRTHATPKGYFRRAAKSKDGRLWFVVLEGVAVVDPRHLPENHLAPPVQIEQIAEDHVTYATNALVKLPPLTQDLRIDYTALSFVAPDKVRFRYRLDGLDTAWRDVGGERQAVYTNLPPRRYRFHVMACNNDGVWNQAGASLDLLILPAFYQAAWFRILLVVVSSGLIWLAYRLRVRQVARQISLRYEERLAERTRIARELHDTLLQNISGFALQLGGLTKTVEEPAHAKDRLRDLRQQAERWLHEARESVWNLRRPISEGQDLQSALDQMGQQITVGRPIRFQVTVLGTRHPAPPKVQEHLLRIAQEATRNAIHHGHATEIRINIAYIDDKKVRIGITDDGCGFDFDEASAKIGHWGLATMRERAQQIDAEFRVSTAPGHGTEIEVVAPINADHE